MFSGEKQQIPSVWSLVDPIGAISHVQPHSGRTRWPLHHRSEPYPTFNHTREEHAGHYTTDRSHIPRSTTLGKNTLAITPPIGAISHVQPHSGRTRWPLHHRSEPYPTFNHTREEHAGHYTTDAVQKVADNKSYNSKTLNNTIHYC